MNELEATRAKLKCLEIVEGTGLNWWEVVRNPDFKFDNPHLESFHLYELEFALGVVEGKPVWEDSQVFAHGIPVRIKQAFGNRFVLADGSRIDKEMLSWNKPKPATLMVELLIEDARHIANDELVCRSSVVRMLYACKKALEQLK